MECLELLTWNSKYLVSAERNRVHVRLLTNLSLVAERDVANDADASQCKIASSNIDGLLQVDENVILVISTSPSSQQQDVGDTLLTFHFLSLPNLKTVSDSPIHTQTGANTTTSTKTAVEAGCPQQDDSCVKYVIAPYETTDDDVDGILNRFTLMRYWVSKRRLHQSRFSVITPKSDEEGKIELISDQKVSGCRLKRAHLYDVGPDYLCVIDEKNGFLKVFSCLDLKSASLTLPLDQSNPITLVAASPTGHLRTGLSVYGRSATALNSLKIALMDTLGRISVIQRKATTDSGGEGLMKSMYHWHSKPCSVLRWGDTPYTSTTSSSSIDASVSQQFLYSGGEEGVLIKWDLSSGTSKPDVMAPRLGDIITNIIAVHRQESLTSKAASNGIALLVRLIDNSFLTFTSQLTMVSSGVVEVYKKMFRPSSGGKPPSNFPIVYWHAPTSSIACHVRSNYIDFYCPSKKKTVVSLEVNDRNLVSGRDRKAHFMFSVSGSGECLATMEYPGHRLDFCLKIWRFIVNKDMFELESVIKDPHEGDLDWSQEGSNVKMKFFNENLITSGDHQVKLWVGEFNTENINQTQAEWRLASVFSWKKEFCATPTSFVVSPDDSLIIVAYQMKSCYPSSTSSSCLVAWNTWNGQFKRVIHLPTEYHDEITIDSMEDGSDDTSSCESVTQMVICYPNTLVCSTSCRKILVWNLTNLQLVRTIESSRDEVKLTLLSSHAVLAHFSNKFHILSQKNDSKGTFENNFSVHEIEESTFAFQFSDLPIQDVLVVPTARSSNRILHRETPSSDVIYVVRKDSGFLDISSPPSRLPEGNTDVCERSYETKNKQKDEELNVKWRFPFKTDRQLVDHGLRILEQPAILLDTAIDQFLCELLT